MQIPVRMRITVILSVDGLEAWTCAGLTIFGWSQQELQFRREDELNRADVIKASYVFTFICAP
jgi:hypothetical protein